MTDSIEGMLEVDRTTAKVKKARKFDDRDWKYIADWTVQEYEKRKEAENRKNREKHWKEIDRQIAMEPSVEFKRLPNGEIDVRKKWMAETELPLQAQALELNVTDARRMLFADGGKWFKANSKVTDDYLRNVEGEGGIRVLGDENFVPSPINQDNANKIVEGFLGSIFKQYDHLSRFDVINSEAFKYGMGIGRGRLERKNVYIYESRGVVSVKKRLPVLIPCSVKNIYLDEPKPTMHSSTVLGPSHIARDYMKFENLALAANKGSTDPDDEDGGWMPKNIGKVVPDKQGYVLLLEIEGDIVIPRKTVRSFVLYGAIITVAVGGPEQAGGLSTRGVIRFRFRKNPYTSYILFPYQHESADDAYPTSPLMKGRTVQQTATDAVNRFLDSAALKNHPPVGWDRNEAAFAQAGGPEIYPTAQWPTTEPVKVYTEIGGDPGALAQVSLQFISLYNQLTGSLPARVGAQTVSHTTAYAKNAELQLGSSRITDYVNQTGQGPMIRWLDMAYRMGRDELGSREKVDFFMPEYGGFVEIEKDMLPDAEFEWFGSQGPQSKQQLAQMKLAALNQAAQIDMMKIKMGMPPRINYDSAIDEILREGGWQNVEHIINEDQSHGGGASRGPAPPPVLPGADQAGAPGSAAPAQIQDLSGGGG